MGRLEGWDSINIWKVSNWISIQASESSRDLPVISLNGVQLNKVIDIEFSQKGSPPICSRGWRTTPSLSLPGRTNQGVGEEKGTRKKSSRVRSVSQTNYQLLMLRCSIALWQDCSCGRKWNKNCSLPEQVEKYLIVDHFLIVPPFRVDFANEDSLIRSSSDDECFDSYSWDLMFVSTEIMRIWRWPCMVPTPQGQGLPWRGGKKLLSRLHS